MFPKIDFPTSEIMVPSLEKNILFKPFLVKQEKLLLMAQETKSKKEVLRAIKQIINSCCVNDDIDVESWLLSDITYVFAQLRAISINNVIKMSFIDTEDNSEYDFSIDLTKIQIIKPTKQVSNKIKINDDIFIIMKHPTASILEDGGEIKDDIGLLLYYTKKCMVEVFYKDDVTVVAEEKDESIDAFVDNFPTSVLEEIKEYFANTQKLEYKIAYTNKNGNKREIVLSTLEDFFTLV